MFCCIKILDEVERRRGVSAALVYPFMRSLMESPFPAPGKIIKVKTFLPGAGNEVRAAESNQLCLSTINMPVRTEPFSFIRSRRRDDFNFTFICGPSGHRAEAAQRLQTGARGLRQSVQLPQCTSGHKSVCLSAAGAQSHLCGQ